MSGDTDSSAATETSADTAGPQKPATPLWKRLLPAGVLVVGLIAFFALGLDQYVSFAALERYHDTLVAWVSDYLLIAALVFMAAYAAMTAFSVPGGAVLTIAGGFLFGIWLGTLLVVTGATLGAVAVFLAARYAVRETLERRAGPFIKKLEAGFREDALAYMFVLRLVPLFPFWLVNIVPAFLGVSLRIYAVATFFGIMPGSFVYASVGNGVGTVLARGERPDLGIIFEPAIITPIVGLAVLALIPVVYKRMRRSRGRAPAES